MVRIAWLALALLLAGSSQDSVSSSLSGILKEYEATRATPTVGDLVQLDRRLRELLPRINWEHRLPVSARSYDPRFSAIGVAPHLFDRDSIGYSGRLLLEAHALDPRSTLRSHTLFSEVFGPAGEMSNEVPVAARAEGYLAEFPNGPFAVDATAALAHFYDDLFKVIRLEESGRRVDYKHACYKPYLSGRPLHEQRLAAQEAGVKLYRRLVDLLPANPGVKQQLAALSTGTTSGWFYCAD